MPAVVILTSVVPEANELTCWNTPTSAVLVAEALNVYDVIFALFFHIVSPKSASGLAKASSVGLIVASDAEGVLGIGDQGVGGMEIPVAKLMVYTLCAGFNPNNYLPVFLDAGTNNQDLLDDPLYLGWRHKRVSGKEYDEMIKLFVEA